MATTPLAVSEDPVFYVDVPRNFTEHMDDFIATHTVNVVLGAFFTMINILLLSVFMSHRPFREKYKLLIALALGDFCNCAAVMLMGLNRVALYGDVMRELRIPIRTPWACAVEPWLWMRGIGDLWPPIIQVLMGVERLTAIYYPIAFRAQFIKRSCCMVATSVLLVVTTAAVGFVLAWLHRFDEAPYFCGRKAAFSAGFATFVYSANVAGYAAGAALNLAAYTRVKRISKVSEKNRHIARLRCYLVISFISTVLVCIPNLVSLTSVLYKKVSDAISKPSVWATCVNSGVNFFVYLALNSDFRARCAHLLGVSIVDERDANGNVTRRWRSFKRPAASYGGTRLLQSVAEVSPRPTGGTTRKKRKSLVMAARSKARRHTLQIL